ncbi:MAG: LLM class flavin-dependent oxidoreductase [Candidatus Latescibacteria bacterium]|nr:LLM class flavin-dependent oxidoreductase [Candidatus Latescibacterota bacterium]
MKLGTFMMPLHPPEKSRTECFEEDIELVILADELGFTEAWIGQHHTLGWEPIPANDLFIANVFPRTKNIRLGTGVSIVTQHHPANIAVRLAYLDHLSRGRLNCGFGQGGVPTDWELFNLPDPKTQGLMTVEGIDMILKLWQAEAPFDFKGQFWHIKIQNPIPELGIGMLLKPYQQPHPPIAMSVIKPQSMAARMAGQRGYIPISTNLVPVSTVAEHWKTYSAGAQEGGGPTPDRRNWRVSRSVIVGRTQKEAWELARHGAFVGSFKYLITILRSLGSLNLIKHDPELPDEAITPEYMLEHQCIIGDVQGCIDKLQQVWETTGGFGTLLMISHDWDDREAWRRSMRLLAEQVVPALPTL